MSYPRSSSPGSRRMANPGRMSDGYYTSASAYASPRSSAERVVPISATSAFVARDPYSGRPRRSTLNDPSRPSPTTHLAPRSHPAVVHSTLDRASSPSGPHARSSRPQERSSDYYLHPATTSSSHRDHTHKKLYSIDGGGKSRLVADIDINNSHGGGSASASSNRRHSVDRSKPHHRHKAYHLSGPSVKRSKDDADQGFSYTDPAGMYRDTEPRWRHRYGSVEGQRPRPSSAIVDQVPARPGPPTSRALDRYNDGLGRASSTREPVRSSQNRASFADGQHNTDPYLQPSASASASRHSAAAPQERPRERPRERQNYEDHSIERRGFGIRSGSQDRYANTMTRGSNESFDARDAHYSDREYAKPRSDPRAYDYPQDLDRDRDYRPRDKDRDRLRDDGYTSERDRDRYYERARRDHDRRDRDRDRDTARDRERDSARVRERERDRDGPRDGGDGLASLLPAALTGLGAVAAAAAAHRSSDNKTGDSDRDREYEDRERQREKDYEREQREQRERERELAREQREREREHELEKRAREKEREREHRPRERHRDRERERDPEHHSSSDSSRDGHRRSRRHHAVEDDTSDRERRHASDERLRAPEKERVAPVESSAPQAPVDPDEDYRRRVEQVQREMASTHESGDSDRERRANGPDSVLDKPVNAAPPVGLDNRESTARENRVRIVEPPSDRDEAQQVRGILKKPTQQFPEDPNPIREGVAPLKESTKDGIPPGARWTKIDRRLVNPQALEEAKERFEERLDCVIVLRVLTKEEIQKFADRTKEIRDGRYYGDEIEEEAARRERRERRRRDREHDRRERDEYLEDDSEDEYAPREPRMLEAPGVEQEPAADFIRDRERRRDRERERERDPVYASGGLG